MVMKTTRLFYLFWCASALLFSGEFVASVNRNPVNLGESFTLSLTLKEASAKGAPFIDALKKKFSIHSQQQLLSTSIINGQITLSTTWKFALAAQEVGEIVIPPLSIDTSEGTLSSEAITIHVLKEAVADSGVKDLILTTEVSNAKPYKNEPITYSIKIVSKRDLANLQIPKITLENAMVETNSEPKIYKKVVDGVNIGIIELSYLITPLKPGVLKIPSTSIQGVFPIRRKAHHGSLLDHDLDLFSMIQGFDQLQPFTLATEEVVLDVQPAIAGMNPWLPAKSLEIEEIWDESQTLQAGEPFTRGFKIVADGVKSSQLPSLSDLQTSGHAFKVYADTPESGEEERGGGVKSYRKEHYTFIPQQSGTHVLPELSIVWWDVIKKEKMSTRIPSKVLEILPAAKDQLNSHTALAEEEKSAALEPPNENIQKHSWLYAVIAVLVILLVTATFWGVTLWKKITQQEHYLEDEDGKKNLSIRDKYKKLSDLNPT